MQFQGKHGYYDHELTTPQPFEVDVELVLNLQPAGIDDDLEKSVDYGRVYDVDPPDRRVDLVPPARGARRGDQPRVLADFPVDEVGVRVRKPKVELGGPLDYAAVEIWRRRPSNERRG